MTNTEHRWEIHQTRQVEKGLRKLPRQLQQRIDQAILSLADYPRPPGSWNLRGCENHYRLRVGDWRICYTVEKEQMIVLIVELAPRARAYRL